MSQQNDLSNDRKPFDQWASDWWNPQGSFKPLHDLHPCRMKFIVEHTEQHLSHLLGKGYHPWQALEVLDIGCGGGLTAESVCRLGALVTGIDESPKTITVALEHAAKQKLNINYQTTALSELLTSDKKFDLILALEVVEHVNNPEIFLDQCVGLLKAQGLLILSTLNRTIASYLKTILAAEHILRLIPKGTHDWRKFLKPAEITQLLHKKGLFLKKQNGINYRPLDGRWFLSDDVSNNFIMAFIK